MKLLFMMLSVSIMLLICGTAASIFSSTEHTKLQSKVDVDEEKIESMNGKLKNLQAEIDELKREDLKKLHSRIENLESTKELHSKPTTSLPESDEDDEVDTTNLAEEADLVSIHSKEEQRFFQGLVREMDRDCWIGLKLVAHRWVWSDGSALDYQNWDAGEPLNWSTEKWVHMRPGNGKWNNVESDYKALVGCKKPAE
ncbi:unnamed protein product, partial [Mesorhabditis belari]|uniref:C-type lectin domain-containing protein n=1 Tax=Mesorhabditis belari TaxID=2138241 RepID=A0AAF3F5Y7_9BILA